MAAIIRDEVNEEVFVYALSAALISRSDTRSLSIPPIWEILPDKHIGIKLIIKFLVWLRSFSILYVYFLGLKTIL